MNEKALNYLGLMRKAGMLDIGETGAGNAIREGRARLLILAPDAGDNARRRAEGFANGKSVILVVLPFGREELSHHVGKANTVMAAVTDIGFAEAFMNALAAENPQYADMAARVAKRKQRAAERKTGARRNNA